MVKKRQKDLDKVSKSLKSINFQKILEDLISRNYSNYNILPVIGHRHLYRIRIGKYRIVFKDIPGKDVEIISIKSRGQVYKGLK